MKKELLLASMLVTCTLVKSQVGINTQNPQGIFNIDGLKNNPTTGIPTAIQMKDDVMVASNGNLGLGVTSPETTLDVNGAITHRETALPVSGNAATVPTNVSQVQLTGAATGTVVITAPAAPNAGQLLLVYNNTTGGFGATLGGVTVPNGKALEFVYSNSSWISTEGGLLGATPVNIYTADGTLTGNRTVTTGANTLAFTGTASNAFSVDGTTLSVDAANDRIGVGTTTPDSKLTVSTPDNSYGFSHTNGTIRLKSFIGSGVASFGTSTNDDMRFMTNASQRMTITAGGNVGIETVTPQKKLHVHGSLQLDDELSLGGTATTVGSAGTAGQVLKSNGPGTSPSWQTLAGVPNATGTVIAVNGQFLVAQEISVQMTNDFTISGTGPAFPIGNLTNEIIDNENLYTGSSANNSFKVSADGVYLITINVQLYTTNGTIPAVGIWDNGTASWVARVNDYYSAPTNLLQTYTLITSIPMLASTTYSFRAANTADTVIRSNSIGSTGSGPVTQISVKRLK
ncbi:hypothetical protein REB14_20560 [Chryseobacterium sp. ES2]|uniref:C1q domain-containing protein n=1 Tax=Chryseobacterium metallicongregator TaxID=3073042 RepID=A0ABU1E9V1_9FLAO|nr:hypothetical protein [Chryseobacterium sp. ES2]MDR4954582.1 hypothetical protein [Chryseobacterium sp. ES2]